jgi:hypothetical protein
VDEDEEDEDEEEEEEEEEGGTTVPFLSPLPTNASASPLSLNDLNTAPLTPFTTRTHSSHVPNTPCRLPD